METEEVIKLVDGIYKNILEKFNPGARQLISAGKAYLKALHGAAAASRLFNEALAKIAVNAQQGGTTDIGSALMSIVGVYKEIQDQHMNILKAFYVDLLVPLETNLEKDTKVVQFEQKKFLQQHKVRADSYSKAASTMKKQRKKKTNPQSAEKEIKSMQVMEEEKSKLDSFCEQSLKNAMTQERRRYGFVLERQCSLAKHWIAYHAAGKKEIECSVDNWNDVASSREFLPPNVESMFKKKIRESMSEDDDASSTTSDRGSITSQLRKTRSIDASCMDMRSIGDVVNNSMNRAKSEYNLTSNTSLITAAHHNHNHHHHNTISTTAQLQSHGSEINHWDQRPIARALYAYLSSGENQLSFLESDRIALVGDRAKGWQFGENLRTQMFGWFPLAYTESEQLDENTSNWESLPKPVPNNMMVHQEINLTPDSSLESTLVDEMASMSTTNHHHKTNPYHDDVSPTRMFGDTIMYRQSKHFTRVAGGGIGGVGPKPGPPPTLPAPVPQPVVPPYAKNHQLSSSHSFSSSAGAPNIEKRRSGPATMNLSKPSAGKIKQGRDGVTNASLHSSNDSGFANEPPPQPEVDYSDEETVTRVPIRTSRHEKIIQNNKSSPRQSQNIQAPPQETATTLQRRSHRRSNDDSAEVLTSSRKSKSNNENIRQSSSFGNLADENTIDFMYRTSERRSRSAKSHNNNTSNSSGGSNNNSNTDKNTISIGNLDDPSDDLLNGNVVKRTKSFWKFGKSDDDILAGMALWKHRDLVQTENEKNLEKKKEATLKRSNRNHNNNNNNNNNNSNNSNNSNRNSNETHSSNLSHSNSTSSSETIKNNNNSNTNQTKRSSSNNNINNSNNNGNNNKNISSEIDQIAIIKSYPLTKSDIDNRISKHNVDVDQIYGAVERRNTLPPPKNQALDRTIERTNDRTNDRTIERTNDRTNDRANDRTIDRTKDRSSRQQVQGNNKHQPPVMDMMDDDDDNMMIVKETTKRRTAEQPNNRNSMKTETMKYADDDFYDDDNLDDHLDDDMSLMARENNFYDDDSVDDMMLMKTVKRKEILKQYYSSGTDTEHNSSSSDPYDCIVVDDHLVRKSEHIRTKTNNANNTNNNIINNNSGSHEKMEFTTFRGERNTENNVKENNKDRVAASRTTSGTLLPRTKLSKTNNNNSNGAATLKNEKSDRRESDTQPRKNRNSNTNNTNNNMTNNKSYGPWYDLWGNDLPPIKNK